jgi:hypothetical protein
MRDFEPAPVAEHPPRSPYPTTRPVVLDGVVTYKDGTIWVSRHLGSGRIASHRDEYSLLPGSGIRERHPAEVARPGCQGREARAAQAFYALALYAEGAAAAAQIVVARAGIHRARGDAPALAAALRELRSAHAEAEVVLDGVLRTGASAADVLAKE